MLVLSIVVGNYESDPFLLELGCKTNQKNPVEEGGETVAADSSQIKLFRPELASVAK
jgi:hypothetical protein